MFETAECHIKTKLFHRFSSHSDICGLMIGDRKGRIKALATNLI